MSAPIAMKTHGITLRITGPNDEGEYWLHLSGSGQHSGINLGVPMGMVSTALLMAASVKSEYIRADLARTDLHEAALSAARAEGRREGLLEAAERLDLAEHDAEERDWRSGANALSALAKSIRAEAALTKIARLGQEWEADRKAHEKEIAVWSENYAALEREREASLDLLRQAHTVLVNLDRICVDPVLDPLIDEMAALIFRAMQPKPTEYERKVAQMREDFPNGI